MSEQKLLPSTNPKPTDATNAFDSIRDQQRAIGWTGDPSKEPVSNETFSDLDDYINRRPSEEVENTYFDDSQEDPTAIESIPMDDLVARWAEADDSNDKTASQAVQDEIERRLVSDDKMSDELRLRFIDRLVAKKEALQKKTNEQVTPPPFDRDEFDSRYDFKDSKDEEVFDISDKDFKDKSFSDLIDDNPGIARDLLDSPIDDGSKDTQTPPPFNKDEFDKKNPIKTPDTDDDRFDFNDNKNTDDKDKFDQSGWGDDDFNFDDPRWNDDFQGVDQTSEVPQIPLPEKLQTYLDKARSEYVRLSAKRSLMSFGKHKNQLAEAKEIYDEAVNAAGKYVAEMLIEQGTDKETVRKWGAAGVLLEDYSTQISIALEKERVSDKKLLRPLYERWATWGGKITSKKGIVGALKKGGVMFAAGLIVGVPAAAIGTAIAGPFGGAFIGVGLAKGVSRGLLGANITKNSEVSVARAQAETKYQADEARINALAESGETITAEDGTKGSYELTNNSVKRNRNRLGKAAVIGAIAGGAGALVANAVGIGGGGSRPSSSGNNNPSGGGGAAGAAGASTNPGGRGPNGGGLPTDPEVPTEPIPSGGGAPTTPEVPITPSGAGGGLPELVAVDSRLPWTHVTEALNNGNGTPDIFAAVEKGRQMGIDIVGRGRGLESVTWNGITYTDNGHINAALDYIMTHEA